MIILNRDLFSEIVKFQKIQQLIKVPRFRERQYVYFTNET